MAEVYALTDRQRGYAAGIFRVVKARGLPPLAAVYAITCSGAESSLTNYENWGTSTLIGKAEGRPLNAAERAVARRSIGLGDGPYRVRGLIVDNLDSMGLFAQRPISGWGRPEDIMRPEYATGKFLDALIGIPGWADKPAADVIRRVQGFYNPAIYTAWLDTARAVVDELDPPAPPPTPTPGPGTDLLEDITMKHTIVIIKGHGSMWITWPIAGVKKRIADLQAKDQFVGWLRSHGLGDTVVEDLAIDQDGVLDSLHEVD